MKQFGHVLEARDIGKSRERLEARLLLQETVQIRGRWGLGERVREGLVRQEDGAVF